ncbi:MAG TPA: hypothetical protein VF762_16340 [Blastocatellia bacterium]
MKYLAVDGFYAKKKHVDGVRDRQPHLITKLRIDANLRYLYTGPRVKRRGRPKLYDGKVNFQDLGCFDSMGMV